ncbi:MAG: YhcH/YjgK/YiaL family protein [Clostridia bacterium]|nr:YhcH/YjgK/YiaL family protein [Clostridia bacterium]
MDKYQPIRELNESGYHFALKALQGEFEDGTYELQEGSFAFITSYETKPFSEGLFEAHKKFIDVQLILSGEEVIATMPTSEMHKGECVKPYVHDIELYRTEWEGTRHYLKPTDYLILYPEDAHMPGVSESPTKMRKAVIKIPVY